MCRLTVFSALLICALLPAVAIGEELCGDVATGLSDKPLNPEAQRFSARFDSGAQWDLCWSIEPQTGLRLYNVSYQPPAENSTRLLHSASIAQILLKYDQDTTAEHFLSHEGLGGANHIPADSVTCAEGIVLAYKDNQAICSRTGFVNLLTSTRHQASLHRHEWSLAAVSRVGSKTIETIWRFSEDGQLSPSVRLSGEISRFTHSAEYGSPVFADAPFASNAVLVYSWRLDFDIGSSPDDDVVEQIQFVPQENNGVKKSIEQTPLLVEAARRVSPTLFRGWLIKDSLLSASADGGNTMGYYLDPQQSGFRFNSTRVPWTMNEFAVTLYKDCELLASGKSQSTIPCAAGLDRYINSESLDRQDVVVWFSLANQLLPKTEDFPEIQPRESGFTLLPFDWSAATPFSPPQ